MTKVKFEDVATRVNTREDRLNTSLLYYVGGEHIESNEMLVQGCGLIKGSTIGPMFYCGFKKGDILLVSRNPHLRKASMVEFDGICSEKTFVLGTKDSKVLLQEFLALVMQSDDFWNYCEEHKSGGVNYFLNWSTLAKYEFYLPSIQEQKEIADKVWSAYRLKESYKKLLVATDEMVKSQFIEMFGNPVTNTKGWKTAKIKDVAPEMPSKEQLSGKIWLLNLDMIESNTGRIIEKVYEDVENALSVQSFDEGNVLFSKLRPYLNKVVIPDEPGMATTELVPLRPEPSKLHKVFLSHMLRGNQFVNYANDIAGGTKMPRMPLTELRNFDCILPPMDKQLEFVFIAEQADKSKFGDFKSQFIEMFGNPFEINSEVVPLSSLCSINPSKPKGLDDSLSVSFIPMDRISEDGEYAEFETKPLKDVKKGFTYCAEDDVLFAKITPCMENGKGAILKGLSNGIGFGSTEFHVLRPILGISNSEWLYFLTKLNGFRIDAAKNMTGTGGQKRVPSSYLLNFKVLKPQLEVQREFAKIVHQADKSKSVIQKALVYLNDIQSDELGKIA